MTKQPLLTRRLSLPLHAGAQRGVALIVALVLLVVALLIGLAGVRGASLQERMSANMYDRSLAFQRAEAALREAENEITASWDITELGGVDCSPGSGALCSIVPETAFSGTTADWTPVGASHDINNTLMPGVPEFHIQFMGTGPAVSNLGLDANADYGNYGSANPPDEVAYYRVTARSSDPDDVGEQSIVVLQSTVKRAF